ncbi:MAG TPA: cytochrome c, partial [Chitinophagaceae bacterium]|nr:cytochrome c [Chitinophagaceae bacterium]
MGSYASQLDTKQRWQVVAYIKKVQSENGGAAFNMISTPGNDSLKAEAPKAEASAPAKTDKK